jgi:hypothetical protein
VSLLLSRQHRRPYHSHSLGWLWPRSASSRMHTRVWQVWRARVHRARVLPVGAEMCLEIRLGVILRRSVVMRRCGLRDIFGVIRLVRASRLNPITTLHTCIATQAVSSQQQCQLTLSVSCPPKSSTGSGNCELASMVTRVQARKSRVQYVGAGPWVAPLGGVLCGKDY